MHVLPRLFAASVLAATAAADVNSYCVAGVNSTGRQALISWQGPVNPFEGSLHVQGLPPHRPGLMVYGMRDHHEPPFGNGFLCTYPIGLLASKQSSAAGTLEVNILLEGGPKHVRMMTSGLIPDPFLSFQYLYRDPVGGAFNASDAIAVVFE